MAAFAIYLDHKLIKSSHAAAWSNYDGSCWDCFIDNGSNMGAKYSVCTFYSPIFNHYFRTSGLFLRSLEHKTYRTCDLILMSPQNFSCT